MPSIRLTIASIRGHLCFAVYWRSHTNHRQLMAFYSLTPSGFIRARAYANEMRIVYGFLANA